MQTLDWIVLGLTQVLIVAYGIMKSRGAKDIKGFLLSDQDMNWFTIGLSIMATQASAITFLSTPGQAFGEGMGFVQFYFGVPIAMVILSVTAVPIYRKLNVFTAYEYLEKRFDLKTRSLGAILFLTQRGLAAGLSIYAPAIILSTVLGWEVQYLNISIGLIVIAYTVSGGTKAVSQTQKLQMLIILLGMVTAGVLVFLNLPEDISFTDAVHVAGKMDKLDVVDLSFDPSSRYNLWAGLLGGMFLALSYFGTDQSQVQRYLGGRSVAESRLGLLMNGMIKVPMQFLILFLGAMLFVFYQFSPAPLHFNRTETEAALSGKYSEEYKLIQDDFKDNFEKKKVLIREMLTAVEAGDENSEEALKKKIAVLKEREEDLRKAAAKVINDVNPDTPDEVLAKDDVKNGLVKNTVKKDRDYVFITFVMEYLPTGLIGLLVAVILSAAMSSAASELNALASTSLVDIYKRQFKPKGSEQHYLNMSKVLTVMWGIYAILFSLFADKLENLIQAVNIIGSLVYGTVLGIFLVAFYVKKVKGTAVFIAAIISETVIVSLYFFSDIGYLWFNFIGCVLVVAIGLIIQQTLGANKK